MGKVIEQLTYFIDMEKEMAKLHKLAEDETKYEVVNLKLLNLITLREALLDDTSWKRETAIMSFKCTCWYFVFRRIEMQLPD